MQPNDKKTLGYLGEDFQMRLAKIFFMDKNFFVDLIPVIDQNMFTNPQLRKIVGAMKDCYEKYETKPSYQTVASFIREKSRNDVDLEYDLATLESLKTLEIDSVDYVKELSSKFFKQQNIVKIANKILGFAEQGNEDHYEECVELMQSALNAGMHNELGESVFHELKTVLSDDYRITIPTGIDKLDEALEGGLGKGELGLLIGGSGFGKTTFGTAICNYAATYRCEDNNYDGYKVLQIVFEDRVKQIQRKHISRITGIEARNLSKPEYIEEVKRRLADFKDGEILDKNLRIVRFPSGEVTASGIKRFLKKLINSGFKPDLMTLDYFECMEHEKQSNAQAEHEREGKTMRKFESMAAEFDMAVWVFSQGSRDSIGMDIVTMDKIAGSFKKAQIAHAILSIARTMDDIEHNKAVLALLKNRAGKSGKVWNGVDYDNGTCRISTDNVAEFGSATDFNNDQNTNLLKSLFKESQKK